MKVYYTNEEILALDPVTAESLDESPFLAAALFAHALGGSKESRKQARALFRKSKHEQWNATLKEYTKRDYSKPKHERDFMSDDLEAFEKSGLPALEIAYTLHRFVMDRPITDISKHRALDFPPSVFVYDRMNDTLLEDEVAHIWETVQTFDEKVMRMKRPCSLAVVKFASKYPLEGLYFKTNEEGPLPEEILEMSELKALGLNGPVTTIPVAFFTALPKLSSLRLGLTKLQSVPPVPNRNFDKLSFNAVKEFPGGVENAETVYISDVPMGSPQFDRTDAPLEVLYLDNTVVPRGLSKPAKLRSLNIENMNVDALPEDLAQCEALTSLQLKNLTGLKSLEAVEGLKSLAWVELVGLDLETLPASLAKVANLTVTGCTFEWLPDDFATKDANVRDSTCKRQTAAAAQFLKLPSTSTVYQDIKSMFRSDVDFMVLDVFKEIVRDFEETFDPQASGMSELLLAFSRLYVDDDHGSASNKFLRDVIDEKGSAIDKAANRALRNQFIKKSTDLAPYVADLEGVQGINTELFKRILVEGQEIIPEWWKG